MTKRKKFRKPTSVNSKNTSKGIVLFHDMAIYENFERCAKRIHQVVLHSQRTHPGAPRYLVLDVQGHRNHAGGFDHDSMEIMKEFLLGAIGPYLTKISTPLYEATNPNKQINQVPLELEISYPDGEQGFWYDVDLLSLRPRETLSSDRKTPPSVTAIASYLGTTTASCLVCWGVPIERAHAVPASLGGSMDVRNFALLCREHHSQAPDIADAEAFWAWIDYAAMRDRGSKWQKVPEKSKEWLEAMGIRTSLKERSELEFASSLKFELRHLYGWSDSDFSASSWDLHEEYHRVLDAATGRHFGIEKKVSTHAWAYDVARRRLAKRQGISEGEATKILLYDDVE